MRTSITIAALFALAATAVAGPPKIAGHDVAYTPPAKWKVTESSEKGVWVGEYVGPEDAYLVLTIIAHPGDSSTPVDFAKFQPKVDAQLDKSGLKPDGEPHPDAFAGFPTHARFYKGKKDGKDAFGVAGIVDGGPVIFMFIGLAYNHRDATFKTAAGSLDSLRIDGKKGPPAYAKK